eukprot:Opistho-2@10631
MPDPKIVPLPWGDDIANLQRIKDVEVAFGTPNKFLQPGRYLIGEGRLSKVCRKKPKARQFFLFNDILVYGTILISKRKYTKQVVLDLRNMTVTRVDDTKDLQNAWQINTPSKSFVLFSVTPEEKEEWVAHIEKCVKDVSPAFLHQDGTQKAAVWVPDDKAVVCMQCQKTRFNPINRKHHCRACGKVVCGDCSKEKRHINHISDKPLRVCTTCAAVHPQSPLPAKKGPSGDVVGLGYSGDDAGGRGSGASAVDGSYIRDKIENDSPRASAPFRTSGGVTDERATEEMEQLGYLTAGNRASVFYPLD